jgi:YYY domain-containing protein
MVDVLLWLATIELLGLFAFPMAFVVLTPLRDRGYAVTKPLGLLLLAYPVWLLGSWGVVPIGRGLVVLVVALLGAVSAYAAWRRRKELRDFLRQQWRLVVGLEVVFLLLFLGWATFRAYDPMINHTEQLMDFAFLNAAAQATSYPPEDPWLRGHGVNYYYFGYLTMGLLTKITGISSATTYNLSLALVPAMAAAGLLGLVVTLVSWAGGSLRQSFLLGLLGVALLGLLGNGEGGLELARAWGLGTAGFWDWVGIKGLEKPIVAASLFPEETWWWWRATRVIDTVVAGQSLDYTIQEFPLFSFFLGDLHPHVMSIPFLLLTLTLLLSLFFGTQTRMGLVWARERWAALLLTGLALGALAFLNAWDLPAFLGLALALLALKSYGGIRTGVGRQAASAALVAGALAGLALLLYLPFYLGMTVPTRGFAAVAGPVTQGFHFAVAWAAFIVLLTPFLVRQALRAGRGFSGGAALVAATLALIPYLVWVAVVLTNDSVGPSELALRLMHLAPGLLVLALLVYRVLRLASSPSDASLLFTLALLAFAGLLVLGPELFYVRDIFESRLNTMFKLYYQAWIVLSVASPVALYYGVRGFRRTLQLRHNREPRKLVAMAGIGLWLALLAAVTLSGAYYSVGALMDKSGGFSGSPTLDGLAFLKGGQEGEYAAIQWLRENAEAGAGLLEAVGGDYTDFGRVSAATGLPTVLGWAGHERTWRGGWEPQDGRAQDVEAIYQGVDVERVGGLLRRYDIRYVVIGPREMYTYGAIGLSEMAALVEPVFEHEGVAIYRVKDEHG